MFFCLASYIECTSSAIEALASFGTLYPTHRAKEIELCIKKAAAFIEENQEPEGSWSVLQLLNGLSILLQKLMTKKRKFKNEN